MELWHLGLLGHSEALHDDCFISATAHGCTACSLLPQPCTPGMLEALKCMRCCQVAVHVARQSRADRGDLQVAALSSVQLTPLLFLLSPADRVCKDPPGPDQQVRTHHACKNAQVLLFSMPRSPLTHQLACSCAGCTSCEQELLLGGAKICPSV